ncbi:MAG: hypothetical protein LBH72_05145, partial [Proteiniphilum sp.]|nr:hypothetical protein [Proteiniphilum sp.]
MKKEIISSGNAKNNSSGSAGAARGGSTRPDERKNQCDNVMMFRSGKNQLGERPSGKGREHPPRRTISLLSDFFVNCLNCDSSD